MDYVLANTSVESAINLLISKATVDDAQRIVAFLNRIGGETDYLSFGLNAFPVSVEEEKKIIAECIDKELCLMLVGTIDGEIVSHLFLDISASPRLSHIGYMGISVCKKYWRKSIGTRMILFTIDWARKKNIKKLQIQVRTDNLSAIRLYKKLGFNIEGVISQSIKIDYLYFDEFLMGLSL